MQASIHQQYGHSVATPLKLTTPSQQLQQQQQQSQQAQAAQATPHPSKPPSPFTARPSTPLKMFTQTPPSANRLEEIGEPLADSRGSNSSSGSRRRRRSGVSPVTRLPALPAKGSYSYGSTTTVMPNVLKHQDTSNPLKELLSHSANLAKSRLTQRNQQRSSPAAEENDDYDDIQQGGDSEEDEQESDDEHQSRFDVPRPEKTDWSKAARPSPAPKVLTEEELKKAAERRKSLRSGSRQLQDDDDDEEEEEDELPRGKIPQYNRYGMPLASGTQRQQTQTPPASYTSRASRQKMERDNQKKQQAEPGPQIPSVTSATTTRPIDSSRQQSPSTLTTKPKDPPRKPETSATTTRTKDSSSKPTTKKPMVEIETENNTAIDNAVATGSKETVPPRKQSSKPSRQSSQRRRSPPRSAWRQFLYELSVCGAWEGLEPGASLFTILKFVIVWSSGILKFLIVRLAQIHLVQFFALVALYGFLIVPAWRSIGESSSEGYFDGYSWKNLMHLIPQIRNPFSRFGFPIAWDGDNFTYKAPSELPETTNDILERLRKLEISFEKFTIARNNQLGKDKQVREEIWSSMSAISRDITMHTKTADAQFAEITGGWIKTSGSLDFLTSKYKELAGLLEKEQQLRDYERDKMADKHDKSMDKQDKILAQITNELEGVIKPRIENLSASYNALERAFEKLEKNLPESLPIRVDGEGNMKIRPEFYRAMADFFRQEFPQGTKGPDGNVVVERPIRWDEFLRNNEESLKTYIGKSQKEWWDAATRDQTVVSKQQFMALLKQEVDKLYQEMDTKVNKDEIEKLDQKVGKAFSGVSRVRADVRNQDAQLAALREVFLSGGLMPSQPGKVRKGKGGIQDVAIGDGDENRIGESLADGLLYNYASTLADYAGWAGGAYVDPLRTSPTYTNHPKNMFYKAITWFLGAEHTIPRPKVVISSVTREPGNCWPFPGDKGQLGLVLREPVYITDFTLEHIEWTHSLIKTAAPKRVDLWADAHPRIHYEAVVSAAAQAMGISKTPELNRPENVTWVSTPQGDTMEGFVRIGSFEYDFHEQSHASQTWAIPLDMRRLNVSSERVVIRVESNYGNVDYTCMYRVRVHGEPVGSGRKQGYSGERGEINESAGARGERVKMTGKSAKPA